MAVALVNQPGAGAPSPAALLPYALYQAGFALRPQTGEDIAFITALYVSHRWEEMMASGWDEGHRLAFLEDQARLQRRHYEAHYFDAQFSILEKAGEPIGRLYLFHNHPTDLRIIELGLMPEHRGKGLGTALLRQVQAVARESGKFCSIHVEQDNPARRLYRRLDFVEIKPVGPYILLEWRRDRPPQVNTA